MVFSYKNMVEFYVISLTCLMLEALTCKCPSNNHDPRIDCETLNPFTVYCTLNRALHTHEKAIWSSRSNGTILGCCNNVKCQKRVDEFRVITAVRRFLLVVRHRRTLNVNDYKLCVHNISAGEHLNLRNICSNSTGDIKSCSSRVREESSVTPQDSSATDFSQCHCSCDNTSNDRTSNDSCRNLNNSGNCQSKTRGNTNTTITKNVPSGKNEASGPTINSEASGNMLPEPSSTAFLTLIRTSHSFSITLEPDSVPTDIDTLQNSKSDTDKRTRLRFVVSSFGMALLIILVVKIIKRMLKRAHSFVKRRGFAKRVKPRTRAMWRCHDDVIDMLIMHPQPDTRTQSPCGLHRKGENEQCTVNIFQGQSSSQHFDIKGYNGYEDQIVYESIDDTLIQQQIMESEGNPKRKHKGSINCVKSETYKGCIPGCRMSNHCVGKVKSKISHVYFALDEIRNQLRNPPRFHTTMTEDSNQSSRIFNMNDGSFHDGQAIKEEGHDESEIGLPKEYLFTSHLSQNRELTYSKPVETHRDRQPSQSRLYNTHLTSNAQSSNIHGYVNSHSPQGNFVTEHLKDYLGEFGEDHLNNSHVTKQNFIRTHLEFHAPPPLAHRMY